MTLFPEEGPRERSIGNIRAANSGSDDVTITKVELVDPVNVEVGSSFVLPLDPDKMAMGVGFPIPPESTDPDFARVNAAWSKGEPAIGASIAPGRLVNLVVGLRQVDKTQCASLGATNIQYASGGKKYEVQWGTTYLFTKLDKTRCPAP